MSPTLRVTAQSGNMKTVQSLLHRWQSIRSEFKNEWQGQIRETISLISRSLVTLQIKMKAQIKCLVSPLWSQSQKEGKGKL